MGRTTTIYFSRKLDHTRLSPEKKRILDKVGRRGETYDDIIRQLIRSYQKFKANSNPLARSE